MGRLNGLMMSCAVVFVSRMGVILNQLQGVVIVKPPKQRNPAVSVVSMVHKKITGRKRHISVDTHGNLLKAIVHAANIQDYAGLEDSVAETLEKCPTLRLFWVDGGYIPTATILQTIYDIVIDIVKKHPEQRTCIVLPRRWVVERTFAWLGRYRILSKEYTHRAEYTERWMYRASIHRMVNRITPSSYRQQAYRSKRKIEEHNEYAH